MEAGWRMTADSRRRASRALLVALLLLLPRTGLAQTDAGIAVEGLLSIQPINDEWLGSPYLDGGVGGQTAGIAIGAGVVTANGFALIGELSTTQQFEQFQTGRLVWANRNSFSNEGSATTHLRDTLISGLAGYAVSTRTQRVVFAGGLSYVHTTLMQDDLDVEDQVGDVGLEGKRRFALTGGVDVLQQLSMRVSLIVGARYSWLGRAEVADQTGAGEHVLRLGAGLRIRLND